MTLYLAFLVVLILLAGATWKLFRSFWRRWARKDLRSGDLIALRGLTIRGGRWSGPYPDRLQRLRGRGFIEGHEGDKPAVTMKGRVALLLGQPVRARRMAFWDRPAPALADRKILEQAMSKARGEPHGSAADRLGESPPPA
jgi:hypothetical protein